MTATQIGNEEYAVLRTLFSRILEPVASYRILYDPDKKVKDLVYVDVNPSYEAVMGIRRENIVGKSFYDVWSGREKKWLDIIFQVARTGIYARHEGWSVDSGKYLHALAFSPVQNFVSVIFLDMTQWKTAEKVLLEKEKLLLELRGELRNLAARLSLAEAQTRRDVALKLHDRVGYSLVNLLNELRSLREYLDTSASESPILWGKTATAIAEAESLLQDTRSLTFEISSPLLYEVGLEPALESLAERMLLPKGITFDFQEYGPQVLIDTNSSTLIYQMTQELLLNVIKHSKATHVFLRVQRGKKRVLVLVEDNGKGFAAGSERRWDESGGMGLFSIRERLYSLGGELKILSEKCRGCAVSMIVPLTPDEEADNENPNIDD